MPKVSQLEEILNSIKNSLKELIIKIEENRRQRKITLDIKEPLISHTYQKSENYNDNPIKNHHNIVQNIHEQLDKIGTVVKSLNNSRKTQHKLIFSKTAPKILSQLSTTQLINGLAKYNYFNSYKIKLSAKNSFKFHGNLIFLESTLIDILKIFTPLKNHFKHNQLFIKTKLGKTSNKFSLALPLKYPNASSNKTELLKDIKFTHKFNYYANHLRVFGIHLSHQLKKTAMEIVLEFPKIDDNL